MQAENVKQEQNLTPDGGYYVFAELGTMPPEAFNIGLERQELNKGESADVTLDGPSIYNPEHLEAEYGVNARVPVVINAGGNELLVVDISGQPRGEDGVRTLKDGRKVDADILLVNPREYVDSAGARGIIPVGDEPLKFGKSHPAVSDGSFGQVPFIRDRHFTLAKNSDGGLNLTADTRRPTELITAKPASVETYDVVPAAAAGEAGSGSMPEAVAPDAVMAFGRVMRDEMWQLIWKPKLTPTEANLVRGVVSHGSRLMLHALNHSGAGLPERPGYNTDYDNDIAGIYNALPKGGGVYGEVREERGQEFGYDPSVTARLLEQVTDGISDGQGMVRGRSEEIAMRIMSAYSGVLRHNEASGSAVSTNSYIEDNYRQIQARYAAVLAERAAAEA